MLFYYIIFFVPAIVLAATGALSNEGRQFSKFLLFLVFLLAAGVLVLRDATAPQDSYNYSLMYQYVSDFASVFKAYHGNYFFSFLQYLAKQLGLSADSFSIALSVLCYLIVIAAACLFFRDVRYIVVSVAGFALTSTFILLFTNVIRQGLALSLFLLFVGLLYRKKYILAAVAAVFSCYSHSSAAVVVMLALFSHFFPISKRSRFALLLFIPLLPFIGGFVLSFFSSLGGLFLKIEGYSDYEYSNTLVYLKAAILYLSLLLFVYYDKDGGLGRNEAVVSRLIDVLAYSMVIAFLSMPILILSSSVIEVIF